MLTSRYPSEHTAFVIFNPLPSTVETVTQTLNRHGYETAAFADQGFMDPHYGLYSGFEIYDNQGGRFEEIYPRALRWLDQRRSVLGQASPGVFLRFSPSSFTCGCSPNVTLPGQERSHSCTLTCEARYTHTDRVPLSDWCEDGPRLL